MAMKIIKREDTIDNIVKSQAYALYDAQSEVKGSLRSEIISEMRFIRKYDPKLVELAQEYNHFPVSDLLNNKDYSRKVMDSIREKYCQKLNELDRRLPALDLYEERIPAKNYSKEEREAYDQYLTNKEASSKEEAKDELT